MRLSVSAILGGFVWLIVALLCFTMFNTVIMGQVVPVFDEVANSTSFINNSRYQDVRGMSNNTFYIVMAIMIIAPVLFIIVYLFFKREPTPYGYNGGYCYDGL